MNEQQYEYAYTSASWTERSYLELNGCAGQWIDAELPNAVPMPHGDGWVQCGFAVTAERLFWCWERVKP